MRKEIIKKSLSYALIPIGVGAGQYIGNLIVGEQVSSFAPIALFSVLASLATFLILIVFFLWWDSRKLNFGESGPVPVYGSPVFWLPLAFMAVFVVHSIISA